METCEGRDGSCDWFVAQAVYSPGSWDGLRNEINGPVTRGNNVGFKTSGCVKRYIKTNYYYYFYCNVSLMCIVLTSLTGDVVGLCIDYFTPTKSLVCIYKNDKLVQRRWLSLKPEFLFPTINVWWGTVELHVDWLSSSPPSCSQVLKFWIS